MNKGESIESVSFLFKLQEIRIVVITFLELLKVDLITYEFDVNIFGLETINQSKI